MNIEDYTDIIIVTDVDGKMYDVPSTELTVDMLVLVKAIEILPTQKGVKLYGDQLWPDELQALWDEYLDRIYVEEE